MNRTETRHAASSQQRMTAMMSGSSERRLRSEDASWVEISSQPSSSSLSSAADEVITTGLRVQQTPTDRKRRVMRHNTVSELQISSSLPSNGDASSQEEYEESEHDSDRALLSSGEVGLILLTNQSRDTSTDSSPRGLIDDDDDDDDDENRTAVNYPINNDLNFTPQPNAFSHPPNRPARHASVPGPESYLPSTSAPRPTLAGHRSLTDRRPDQRSGHAPQNILSPSYNAAAHHDEALRTSLSTLLSCAAAARGLSKSDTKRADRQSSQRTISRGNRIEPTSFRLVPESALPSSSAARASPSASPIGFDEPTFKPTLRRGSTSTSTSSPFYPADQASTASPTRSPSTKRKTARNSSHERRNLKKARRSHPATPTEEFFVSPTLLTWLVSAGVVVALSALSFRAGYSMGKEAGRLEAGGGAAIDGTSSIFATDEPLRGCAREAGRQGLGFKRSLAKSAVQV